MSALAILGGTPVRTAPFTVEPMVDEDDERMILDAVRARSFSRYIGSNSPTLEKDLRATSAAAAANDDYWHFLGGPHVRAFAAEFAEAMGVRFAVPVNAATSGLSVALAAAGVGAGDEVILPAISFSATASAVLMFNSIPVFVDVEPDGFCLDPALVEAAITERTKALLVVHLAGNIARMDALLETARRHNLVVIEDAAQAIGAEWGGAKTGTLGDAGVFSFQQSKNIMTGEGGMIVTDDAEIARRARLIVNHGEVAFDDHHGADDLVNMVGFNFRLPELCAALGRSQLRKLEKVNDWRLRNAAVLRDGLSDLPGLRLPPSQRAGNGPGSEVPHMFVALHDSGAMGVARERFVAALRAEGVPVGTGYPRTLYAAPLFKQRIAFGRDGCPWTCGAYGGAVTYEDGQCPVGERLLNEEFLWFYHIAHSSTEADMADIVRAVQKVVAHREELAAADVAPAALDQGRAALAPSQVKGG